MNNEPVAWLIQAKIWHEFTFSKPAEDSEDVVITPLYTHPSEHDLGIAEAIGFDKGHEAGRQLGMRQERALWELSASTQEIENPHPAELTDEEIRECIHQIDPNKTDMFMSFARAILRKAQEK